MERLFIFCSILLFFNYLLAWEIIDYDINIDLKKDGTFLVQEKITVDFGEYSYHGIYREIPIKYHTDWKNLSIRLKLKGVTDEKGEKIKYKISYPYRNIRIRIGDPDVLVSGVQVYNITYSVRNAFLYGKKEKNEFDVFYWNLTGNDWSVRINNVKFKCNYPVLFGSPVEKYAYKGIYGFSEPNVNLVSNEGVVSGEVDFLSPGDGVTILLKWKAETFKRENRILTLWWFITDNFIYFIPVLTLVFMWILWYKKGRDAVDIGTVMVEYSPPEGVNPVEAGIILDQNLDSRDLSAMVINLAVKGKLKIELGNPETDKDDCLILDDSFENDSNLLDYEKRFLKGLVDSSVTVSEKNVHRVNISKLKNKFYIVINDVKDKIFKDLMKKQYFVKSPEKVKKFYIFSGILVGFLILYFSPSYGSISEINFFKTFIIAGLTALIIIGFGRAMPSRTVKGVLTLRQILGFKEFISRVEKDRIARFAEKAHILFQRVLPYAIAFGIEEVWAEKFEGIEQAPVNWVYSPYPGYGRFGGFKSISGFTKSLSGSLSHMSAVMVATPRGGSGGKGGGGGFSGGGFGGGGGGAW